MDAWVLRDVGKASQRAMEVRDELVGTVANSELAVLARKRVADSVVAPLGQLRSSAQGSLADGIKMILSMTGGGQRNKAAGEGSN